VGSNWAGARIAGVRTARGELQSLRRVRRIGIGANTEKSLPRRQERRGRERGREGVGSGRGNWREKSVRTGMGGDGGWW
jgi:hypothetical protein